MDGLLAAAGGGAEAIAPAAADGGVAQLLAEAERLAGAVQGADPELDGLGRRGSRRCGSRPRTWAASCAATRDSLEAEPGRLQEVEERLEQYDRLERKHGGSVAAVLEHAERCRAERERLEQAEVATERAEAGAASGRWRSARSWRRQLERAPREAAPRLAERVREELAALAMEDASFEVRLEPRDEIGPDRRRARSS